MGEMTKNQKKEALRAWRQKEKKSYCLEKKEVEELFEYLEEALEEEECDNSLKIQNSGYLITLMMKKDVIK